MRGEFELIEALRERIAAAGGAESEALVLGSGDDASITVRDGATATSVDALVEGVHFRMPPFTARQVGHKALAVALSDLAAMGARPGEAYIQLGVSERVGEAELIELAAGLGDLAAAHGVSVAGGDVTRAAELLLAVTVVGQAPRASDLVRRDGARPGDAVLLTGELGGAAAGLLVLEDPELGGRLDQRLRDRLVARQTEPVPRLAAGRALADAGASAMIDLSDGLGADAGHLAAAGGVSLSIELGRVPVQAGVEQVAERAALDPLDLVADAGEDYELLAAVPANRAAEAIERVRTAGGRLTVVGAAEAGAGVRLRGPGGDRPARGHDQFRSRRAPPGPA